MSTAKIITLDNLATFKTQADALYSAKAANETLSGNKTFTGLFTLKNNLVIGQANGTVRNIQIYNSYTNANYTTITPSSVGADVALVLPSQSGTLALTSQISSVYKYRGSKTVAQLNGTAPSGNVTEKEDGDVYNVTDSGTLTDGNVVVVAGDNVAWVEADSAWDKLAGAVDTSNFYTKTEADTTFATKTELEDYLLFQTFTGTETIADLYTASGGKTILFKYQGNYWFGAIGNPATNNYYFEFEETGTSTRFATTNNTVAGSTTLASALSATYQNNYLTDSDLTTATTAEIQALFA